MYNFSDSNWEMEDKGGVIGVNPQKSNHKIFHGPSVTELLTNCYFTSVHWRYCLISRLNKWS